MIKLDHHAGLTHTLQELAAQGQFEAVVLVGEEGLPLAIGSSGYSAETVAAMVALVKSHVQRTQMELELGILDEVSIVAEDKVRLVCRYFSVGAEALTLAVMVPPHQSYRHLTNQAIKKIKAML